MEDFLGFLSPKEAREIEEQFREMEMAEHQDDSWMLWRQKLNHCLSDEGIAASWGGDESFVAITPLFGIYREPVLKVPVVHLRYLWEEDAAPIGVAAYLKAVLHDNRFRLWRFDEEDHEVA